MPRISRCCEKATKVGFVAIFRILVFAAPLRGGYVLLYSTRHSSETGTFVFLLVAGPNSRGSATSARQELLCLDALRVALDDHDISTRKQWFQSTVHLSMVSLEFCIACRLARLYHVRIATFSPWLQTERQEREDQHEVSEPQDSTLFQKILYSGVVIDPSDRHVTGSSSSTRYRGARRLATLKKCLTQELALTSVALSKNLPRFSGHRTC